MYNLYKSRNRKSIPYILKVTTTTTGVGHEGAEVSRLEQDTNRMLKKEVEVEKVVRLPEGRKDESSKKKIIFNSKGKITKKESE